MFVVAVIIIVCLNALALLLQLRHIHDVVVVSTIRIVHQPQSQLQWQQSFLFRSTSAGTTTTTATNSTNPTHLNNYKNRNSYYVTAAFTSFVPQSPVSSTGWTTRHRFNNGGAVTSTATTPWVDGRRTRTAIAGTLPIRYIPSQIQWNNVSLSYPKKSVLHQMLSSVPYRPWALQNISLMVTHNNNNRNQNHSLPQWNTSSRWWVVSPYVLLTGMSSSGKSTLLQTVMHVLPPTCGTVTIGGSGAYGTTTTTTTTVLEPKLWAPTPILLVDGGGDDVLSSSVYKTSSSWMTIQQLRHEHDRTIGSILQQDIQFIIRNTNHTSDHQITTQVLHDLLFCCNFHATTITETTTTPAQLLPSEQYKFVLVRAAFYSIFGRANRTNHENHSNGGTECSVFLPGPILLLDEYLDRETSTIVQSVQTALTSMCDYMGAICIVSTHYPQRFATTTIQQQQRSSVPSSIQQQPRSSSSFTNRTTSGTTHRFVQPHSIITLCRGEILHVI
jgi:energy-coupling factor transporter ATP-binding protein EcfA2